MDFRIPSPCPEPWEEMAPRPEGRHCARCDRTLIDFSSMTRARAEAVRRGLVGPVCGRLAVDRETGEPWFVPETAAAPRWAGPVVLAAALTLGCSASGGGAPEEIALEAGPSVGPPMDPVALDAPAPPQPESRAVPAAELAASQDGGPSAEQRRLTEAKRARSAPAYPPHVDVIDGMML